MENFFNYLNTVTSSSFLTDFVQGFSGVMDFLFTTVTTPAGEDFSVISLVFGTGLAVYLTFSVIKFFIPL
jgi:hypothetical protein